MTGTGRVVVTHGGLLAVLLALNFLLSAYHHGIMARVMVLATYAVGYNILFGYTGLLSLGHAMFFASGMYGLALPMQHLGLSALPAFGIGIAAAALLALVAGALALRTTGVAFMIITLMFAQSAYLTILLAGEWTRGDEGFVIAGSARQIMGIDLSQPDARYLAALGLFAAAFLLCLAIVRSPFGRVLIAIRENEDRTRLLGYNTGIRKLAAVVLSGGISGASGAAYALLFGYAGASFGTVQYSILPLLWVLLGGAGTVIGPFIGTLFMFYLIDIASGLTRGYMALAGLALILLTLFAPGGIMGEVRRRLWRGLP